MNTPSPLVPARHDAFAGQIHFFLQSVDDLDSACGADRRHAVARLQGHQQNGHHGQTPPPDTNTASADTSNLPPVNPAGMSNTAVNPQQPGAQQPMVTQPLPPVQPPVQPPVAAPVAPPAATGTEYVIASGDTLGAIAHRNGLSLKALLEANPGVNPKKLKVGQKVQIPAGGTPVASAASPGAGATDVAAASGETTVYTVKTGDTLSKIAKANHTSFKKIMALNDLKTDLHQGRPETETAGQSGCA